MSRRKTERLLSLVVCLLSARRYLTATQIRAAVPGYPDSFDAFKRMFERDKDELRELGIPLETGTNAAGDEESGLPDLAAGLRAARHQAGAGRGGRARPGGQGLAAGRAGRRAAEGALLKLRAAGIDAEDLPSRGSSRGCRRRRRRSGRCGKRCGTGGRWRSATGRPGAARRSGATSSRGAWSTGVAAGTSSARTPTAAERVFRLSRIDGAVSFTGPPGSVTVPPGTDVRGRCATGTARPRCRARLLRVRSGAGYGLRRGASAAGASPTSVPGWDLVELLLRHGLVE